MTNNDGLQSIISLVGDYHGVLDRNESLACNLGARSLGPILIKRFERMFDAPPRVIVNHGKEGTQVTWLDVADFARNKPEQFALERNSMGQQTCQFWTKQCQVQISEDDYVLISSGIPQRLIPPQPIVQDEENELGTLEILEKNLNGIIHLADQVAAKARQLNHRMRSRKTAILDRRASDAEVSYTAANAANASSNNMHNGNSMTNSPVGFVAVNNRQHIDANSDLSRSGASQSTHNDLMSRFFTINEKNGKPASSHSMPDEPRRAPTTTPQSNTNTPHHSTRPSLAHLQSMHSQHQSSSHLDFSLTDSFAPNQAVAQAAAMSALGIPASLAGLPSLQQTQPSHLQTPQPPTPSVAPAAAPFAPSSALNTPPVKDEGPYKSQMVQRMEQLKKGEIIFPPCDRCRRLHMDCTKNLTACAGCTKKHAKCSWREVQETELLNSVPPINPSTPMNLDEAVGPGAMVDPQLKDRSKGHVDGGHTLPAFSDVASAHSYGHQHLNGMNGRSMSYQRPISSRSSSGNGHGGGFDPQILNADTSTPNGHHSHGMQSPLDPATAASLAAAAQAVSSRDGSESNERKARDSQRDKMGMGVGAVVA